VDPTIKDFEAALAELDPIVKKLEEGDLPLEASLQLYERGRLQLAPASLRGDNEGMRPAAKVRSDG